MTHAPTGSAAPRTPATYTPFDSVLYETVRGRPERARDTLGALVDDLLRRGDPRDLQYHIFAAALSKRFSDSRQTDINLYLRQFERSQISLFNLVARHLPTVSLAGRIANDLLSQVIAPHAEVTLIDIGIGTGRQEVVLLRMLAERGALPERLTILAVEPDGESLRTAERVLRTAANDLAIDFAFEGIDCVIEDVADATWRRIARSSGTLIAHGAFAVHHIRLGNGDRDPREELFQRLHHAGVADVVLCEPNSDHHTPVYYRRFANCWQHFEQTFDLIQQLDVPAEDRTAMKMFFAREIEDILGNSEEHRCERHESVNSWIARLGRAGFVPAGPLSVSDLLADRSVGVTPYEGYVGIDYGEDTLVAVICATATPAKAVRSERPLARSIASEARARDGDM
ncbi:MAG: hypothetical protein NVS4B3_17090 [Gemmatimonadaceae bacterium]